jgi:hypothetical protein
MGRAGKKGRAAMRIQRAVRKRGLNKTEKKQTKQIVKNALKAEHALKYFNSDDTDSAAAPARSTVGGSLNQVSVLAYSSTTALNDAGVQQKYGQQNVIPLDLAKPFRNDETNSVLAENAPNGNTVAPKIAKASFSIERVFSLFPREDTTVDIAPANSANNLPITFRIVKIEFKTAVGTQEVLDPNTDLWLDYRTGVPTGIDQPDFDRLQCRYAKINTKKYTKLMDTMFTINQNNIIVPQNNSNMWHMPDFFTKAGSAIKHLTVPFQLSQRKNGKLYYEDPNGAVTLDTFTSGGKRQLLLIHSWFDNGHLLLGGEGQPTCPTSADIQIKHKCQSAFVDVM